MSKVAKYLAVTAAAAFTLLAGSQAVAEQVFDSPSGEVRFVKVNGQTAVLVGGEAFPLGTWGRGYIHSQWGNHFLINYHTGGTACPTSWVWLNTGRGQVGLSETFGCAEAAWVEYEEPVVTVTMATTAERSPSSPSYYYNIRTGTLGR